MSSRPTVARPRHPVLREHAGAREANVQDRAADRITAFAGSMPFVYVHLALFAAWMLLLERRPWATLTLVVSLEAIVLSAFVLISQNRADARHQALVDHQWETVQAEERQNEELLALSREILALTRAVHALAVARPTETAAAVPEAEPAAG